MTTDTFINNLPLDQATNLSSLTTEAVASDDSFMAAYRYRLADTWMRVADDGTIASTTKGLGYDSTGALVVTSTGSRVMDSNGLSFDSSGRVRIVFDGTAVVWPHGWPVDSDDRLCVKSGTPPPVAVASLDSGLILLTTFGIYTHTATTGLGTLTTPANYTTNTTSYTARITAVSPAGSDDSGALGPAASINHAQYCTDTGTFCATDPRTNVNDVFGVFSSAVSDQDDASFSYSDQKCSGEIFGTIGSPTVPTMQMSVGAASNVKQLLAAATFTGTATAINTMTVVMLPVVNSAYDINFNAQEYLEAYLSAAGLSTATATMTCTIVIVKTAGSVAFFSWTPDGTTGALSPGGTALLCPFTLNDTASVVSPASGADFTGASLGTANSGRFKASLPTMLADVSYTMTVITRINISSTVAPAATATIRVTSGGDNRTTSTGATRVLA